MESNKLIGMTNRNYANLLKKSLEIWMFVPCDEQGNVLEKPISTIRVKGYELAKERCLFDGFEIAGNKIVKNDNIIIQFNDFLIYLNHYKNVVKTIEDLVNHNLQLTPSAF